MRNVYALDGNLFRVLAVAAKNAFSSVGSRIVQDIDTSREDGDRRRLRDWTSAKRPSSRDRYWSYAAQTLENQNGDVASNSFQSVLPVSSAVS